MVSNRSIAALKLLPPRYRLRLVGRVADPDWLNQQLSDLSGRVELVPPVNYSEVQAEIDACDILLAPSGSTLHSERYRSPLKIFDYMVRGKPIVAANVSAHRVLLREGENALLYCPHDVPHLAAQIRTLVEQSGLAEQIATRAWMDSARYTYAARAERILGLLDRMRRD